MELQSSISDEKDVPTHSRRLGRFQKRLKHFTWAWFSTTMATGSLAVVLYQTPHQFRGLLTIGKIIFVIDLVLFCTFCVMIAIRFTLTPRAITKSLHHPTESFYFGTFWVSTALILVNISNYAAPHCGPWLVKALEICFWCYVAVILLVAVFQYYVLFITERLKIHAMMPAWALPIYPLLVTGPLAGSMLDHQPPSAGVSIWVGGVACQGLGWMVATFLYVMWTLRLLSDELPAPSMRPGMYIAVGPTGYTAQALVLLGRRASKALPTHFMGVTSISAAEVIQLVGGVSGIFIWLLAAWYFSITTAAVLHGCRRMSFNLSWWAFVFPNAGFTLATIQIANVLDSNGIKWVTSAMTVLLFVMWIFVGICHIKAVWTVQILWPGKDEDEGMTV